MILKLIRKIVGGLILFWDRTFVPKGIQRDEESQAKVDEATKQLALYQYPACPFCVKVRRAMKRLSINMELLDPRGNEACGKELIEGGGKLKTPCLRITENGETRWMYESSDIIDFLESKFA